MYISPEKNSIKELLLKGRTWYVRKTCLTFYAGKGTSTGKESDSQIVSLSYFEQPLRVCHFFKMYSINHDDEQHQHRQQIEATSYKSCSKYSGGDENDRSSIFSCGTKTTLRENDHDLSTEMRKESKNINYVDGFTFYSNGDNRLYFSEVISVFKGDDTSQENIRFNQLQRVSLRSKKRKTRLSYEVHPSVLYRDLIFAEEGSERER